MWFPTVDDVLVLHRIMVDASGGSHGVRDVGLIESALHRAQASFGGVDAYNGIEAKAAAVGYGLTQNHGFVDGNKRIGMATMLLILRRNGVDLRVDCGEIVCLGLAIASGEASQEAVFDWIVGHKTDAPEA